MKFSSYSNSRFVIKNKGRITRLIFYIMSFAFFFKLFLTHLHAEDCARTHHLYATRQSQKSFRNFSTLTIQLFNPTRVITFPTFNRHVNGFLFFHHHRMLPLKEQTVAYRRIRRSLFGPFCCWITLPGGHNCF